MKTISKALVIAFVALIGAGAYIAFPFYTVWQIREAMRGGNSEYLAGKIEWASIKETLKPSIARMALDLPPEPSGEVPAGEPARKPSLWQRFKAYMGQGVVNRVVERYVTPEGLPQLFTYRKAYKGMRDKIAGVQDETGLSLSERVRRFWSRVERAEFKSLTRFEIDVRDKLMPERRVDGVLELRGLEWKLTELRIHDAEAARPLAAADRPDAPTDR